LHHGSGTWTAACLGLYIFCLLSSPVCLTPAVAAAAAVAQVGWKHQDAVAELEAKRKAKASKFYEAKKKSLALRAKAAASVA
jgi:hypothetical protein